MGLQTECIEILEKEYGAYIVKVISASRSGVGDILACIKGLFYLFEIKDKGDTIKPLQKENINRVREAGGKGYEIHSTERLRSVLNTGAPSDYFPELTRSRLKL